MNHDDSLEGTGNVTGDGSTLHSSDGALGREKAPTALGCGDTGFRPGIAAPRSVGRETWQVACGRTFRGPGARVQRIGAARSDGPAPVEATGRWVETLLERRGGGRQRARKRKESVDRGERRERSDAARAASCPKKLPTHTKLRPQRFSTPERACRSRISQRLGFRSRCSRPLASLPFSRAPPDISMASLEWTSADFRQAPPRGTPRPAPAAGTGRLALASGARDSVFRPPSRADELEMPTRPC